MDDFEALMNELEKLPDEERDKKVKELAPDCVCPICPTYNDCAKETDENVFCITGKSKECITMELGCLCPTCPLGQKYKIGVIHNFYCNRGSELELR